MSFIDFLSFTFLQVFSELKTKEFLNHQFDKDDVIKTNSLPPDIFRQQILSEGQSSVDTNINSDTDSGFQRSGGSGHVKSETLSYSYSDDFILDERSKNQNISSLEGMFRSTEDVLSSVGDSESSADSYSVLKTKWMKNVDAATLSIIKVTL